MQTHRLLACLAVITAFSGAAPELRGAAASLEAAGAAPKPAPTVDEHSSALARAPAALAANNAEAATTPLPALSTEALTPKHAQWSFAGIFGTFDRAALQRGFQVYKMICSNCHALSHVAFRSLGEPGGPEFTPAEVRAIAAGYNVPAGPDEQGRIMDANGQPFMRPATAADYVPSPFINDQAARVANNGALPPDLSLIVKARAHHADYVYSILTGFGLKPPASEMVSPGLYYNPYFPGHQIAMPPPLMPGAVRYSDGTPATVDQMARDVTTFLAWASEPRLEERKRTGFNVMAFLLLFTALLYFSYRRVWHGHHDVGALGEGEAKPSP